MDDLVRPAIEKIKLQEQDNKVRLREEREYNETILSLNKAIHNTSINLEKLKKENQSLITTTDQLQQVLIVEKIRQNALSDQVIDCRKELDELQKNSLNGISSVWNKRSKIVESVQNISDKCDIWALLIKPRVEIKPNMISKQKCEQTVQEDINYTTHKLKAALDRRSEVITLRNTLLTEPDVGEEFVRTKNALQYSMEMMGNEQKESFGGNPRKSRS